MRIASLAELAVDDAGPGDRPGSPSLGGRGSSGAPTLPRLGSVPRGTKVRGTVAAVPARLEATQRGVANAAQPESVVRAWDPELIESGDAHRRVSGVSISSELRPHVAAVGERLLETPVELTLADGWLGGTSFADALGASWRRDAERGTTHVGPHRADVGIRVGRRSSQAPGVARAAETDRRGDAAGPAGMRRVRWVVLQRR